MKKEVNCRDCRETFRVRQPILQTHISSRKAFVASRMLLTSLCWGPLCFCMLLHIYCAVLFNAKKLHTQQSTDRARQQQQPRRRRAAMAQPSFCVVTHKHTEHARPPAFELARPRLCAMNAPYIIIFMRVFISSCDAPSSSLWAASPHSWLPLQLL